MPSREGGSGASSSALGVGSKSNKYITKKNKVMNNYLKSYPYLFVRESDQTDYFCTLCDAFLKEEELQAHLFDGHQAEDCSNYFVRVVADNLGQKKYVQICVVCWGKLPGTSDMAAHRAACKITTNGQTLTNHPMNSKVGKEESNHHHEAVDNDQEVTKLVTTPDIQCYEDMEGPEGPHSSATSKTSSPPPPPPALQNAVSGLSKRGRKKQLHPQQVLTPERIKEAVCNNLVQCGLCDIVIPAPDEAKHLQEWHRLTVPLENTSCPLCNNCVPLLELVPHLTVVHAVTPPSTGHALLLWILTTTQARKNNNTLLNSHQMSAMLLQSMLPALKQQQHQKFPHSSLGGTPTSTILTAAAASMAAATPPKSGHAPPPSQQQSSFLQSLLNGDQSPATPPRQLPPVIDIPPPNVNNTPPMMNHDENNRLEYAVTKLTKKHLGLNNTRESYQCQVCSKWFAVPPIKHLRGHLVTFKEELRSYIGFINNGGYACLTCFRFEPSPQDMADHVAMAHGVTPKSSPSASAGNKTPNHAPNPGNGAIDPVQDPIDPSLSYTPAPPSRSGIPTVIADPKGVELDNAGRVKSGKVRKQCELCGQWSNIKWFFKHMSEMHNALFCRCCREYLPIHEQEEHRKFHAEPPYMGQKIRIENGQPIIIDRKERASLTPIGSLAAWGGSSGGMVVKAIDDGTSQLISRKRKGSSLSNGSASNSPAKMSHTVSKDTLMPKETCPVCGIQITYKNLARHIKLRHKIKYKFCHKCRKFVPNDTYEDHRVTCNAEASGSPMDQVLDASNHGADTGHDSVDASDYLDMDGASALVINTDDNDDSPNDDDSKRSNTSKNKLESLLGKEFKHPRRKCGICGYMVSYSNYKRHLKNAHPSINHEEYAAEEDQPKFEDQENNDEKEDYLECHICGDHIMKEFLERHLKMNHPNEGGINTDQPNSNSTAPKNTEVKLRDCPVCEVKMRVEGIVKHCKLKHKMSFKWCRPCEKYIGKKQYKTHIQSGEHKSNVNEGEKHSSHEEDDDEEDDSPEIIENEVKLDTSISGGQASVQKV